MNDDFWLIFLHGDDDDDGDFVKHFHYNHQDRYDYYYHQQIPIYSLLESAEFDHSYLRKA